MIKSTVGTKIGAGFGLALVILLVIGLVSYRNTTKLVETASLVAHTHRVLENLTQLNQELVDCETGERGYIITGLDSYLQPYRESVGRIDELVTEIDQLTRGNPEQLRRLAELQEAVKVRLATLQEGIDTRRQKGLEQASAWMSAGAGKDQMDAVRKILNAMQTAATGVLAQRTAEADAGARQSTHLIVGGTIAAFVLLGFFGAAITRDIAGPLRQMSTVAERIGSGDLSADIAPTGRRDEVGVLTQAFARMTNSLRAMAGVAQRIAQGDLRGSLTPQSDKDLLGTAFASMIENLRRLTTEIAEGVTVLGASANQISTSTTQFAASATETATAIGETTTTVEEVRQTAQISSQKARAVSETAQKVSVISQTGRKSTEETVEGMKHIREQMGSVAESMVRLSEQSQAIGQIVTTVEDLAAQSNLLAVNAAIEAAKAGEHGKGFAVVAQEVKSLADQSKQATNQVRAILNDIQKATTAAVMSTEQGSKAVESGVRQSVQAGQAIQMLADGVAEAAQSAVQIAASSQQQLVGVDQVASAMESIKQASTQNVDSAKQLEASARDLQRLGETLKQLVARYKV
jgi:methyl-accepting chemotaxis protein